MYGTADDGDSFGVEYDSDPSMVHDGDRLMVHGDPLIGQHMTHVWCNIQWCQVRYNTRLVTQRIVQGKANSAVIYIYARDSDDVTVKPHKPGPPVWSGDLTPPPCGQEEVGVGGL